MLNIELKSVRRILCLGAHADDIEIGCGGSVLSLLQANRNIDVRWVVLSAVSERAAEATASAKQFLANAASSHISVERFRDGFFPYVGGEIKEYFERLKAEPSPDLIFTHYSRDLHQDHRVVTELTWNTFRNHLILEYEIPKYDGGMGSPNCFVPMSLTNVETKVRLLMESFPSQHKKQWFDADTFRSLMRLRGMECHAPEKFAEGFYARKISFQLK